MKRIKCVLMTQTNGIESVRVFFALWPSDTERSTLTEWQIPLKRLAGGRVMSADSLHATLVFIGGIDQSRLDALQLTASEVNMERFELRLAQAHYWGHNHIVYAAPDQMPVQLAHLVNTLETSLNRNHFQFDRHTFKPHITLLRHAHWTDQQLPQMQPINWLVEDFALVQSRTKPDVANYRVLARFPLRAGAT